MADESVPGRGKGKRPAEDMYVNSLPHVPTILRRHHHRRRNVAANVWGPSLPGQSTQPQPFNVYKAILRHPNLFFQFAIRLPSPTIVDLYAIDKEFHYRFNKYSISIIADYASYHAYHAAYIFSWVLFPELCISDPMLKPMDGRPHLARDIPSLRWTKMVIYRDSVVRGILTSLGLGGLRAPRGLHTMLMKYWLLMEMKTNDMRTAFLSDDKVWSNADLCLFHLFLMKLDMRISHPLEGLGLCGLSHMLLTQKSLSKLYKVLTGKVKLDYDDATDILVRTYLSEDLDTDAHTWLDDETENGVLEEEWGLLCREVWDMWGGRLEPAVDMVITEGLRRDLHVENLYLDFVLYGFVDEVTQTNLPTPRKWRGDRKVVLKEAWPPRNLGASAIDKFDRKSGPENLGTAPRLVVPELSGSPMGEETVSEAMETEE